MIGLALSLMLAGAPAASDPLAPAMAGQVQCYLPDKARKTCRSLGAFAKGAAGVQNTAVVLISENPVVTMEMTAPVQVKGGQVCGTLTSRDVAGVRFRVEGQPADAERAAGFRNTVSQGLASMIGHEMCTSYASGEGGLMTAQASLDGKPAPSLDQPMIWVSPADGYRVAP